MLYLTWSCTKSLSQSQVMSGERCLRHLTRFYASPQPQWSLKSTIGRELNFRSAREKNIFYAENQHDSQSHYYFFFIVVESPGPTLPTTYLASFTSYSKISSTEPCHLLSTTMDKPVNYF
ncbi:hypothetical protein EB796_021361 [Bugula neritina]|uniref:Uncharacterized protein n=1 Tax=Bugula neritina TaxID=10212 RepID=A0A7J7J2M1_BUGNE|nr:hypothetical protein EB796_021361 [Bugula neritina]